MTARGFVLLLFAAALAVIATAQVARESTVLVSIIALSAIVALAAFALLIERRTDRPWMFESSSGKTSQVHVSGPTRAAASQALTIALAPLVAALAGLLLGGPTNTGVALALVLAFVVVIPLAHSPSRTDGAHLTALAVSWGGVRERMSALAAQAALEEGRFLHAHAATRGAERAYARAERLKIPLRRIRLPTLVVEIEEDAEADTVDRIRNAFRTFDLLATVTPTYRRASRTPAPLVLRTKASLRGLLEHFHSQSGTWPQEAALRFAQLLESLWRVHPEAAGELVIEDQDAELVVRVPIGPSLLLAAELLWQIDVDALAGKARARWWSLSFDPASGWMLRLPDGSLMRAPLLSSSAFLPDGRHRMATVGAAAGAPTIHTLEPVQSRSGDATTVTIRGNGIVCTPKVPTVSFGGLLADVVSCGNGTVTVLAPAHAPGTVSVTVTNLGSAPSNGLTFTYLGPSSTPR